MNRRGFLGALLAMPAAAAAIAVGAKASTLSPAKYTWRSVHDGFAFDEAELVKDMETCWNSGGKPDVILCSETFWQQYTGALSQAKTHELKVQSLRRLARSGSPATQRFAYARLRQLRSV